MNKTLHCTTEVSSPEVRGSFPNFIFSATLLFSLIWRTIALPNLALLLLSLISIQGLILDATAEQSAQVMPQSCGVIVPLSGKVAEWGQWTKGGIELAAKDNNPYGLQFIYEDDEYIPAKSIAAAKKLLNLDKVSCLITLGSSTSMAVQPLAENAGVPMFTIAISPQIGTGLTHVFRYYIPIKRQIDALAAEITRRGYKKVALLTSEHDATIPLTDGLLEKKGFTVVFDERITSSEGIEATLALKLRQTEPDAVFLNVISPLPSTFARRLREIGYRGDFFSGPTLESVEEVKAAQGALENTWFVTIDTSGSESFSERYQNEIKSPSGTTAYYGYDMATIILNKPPARSMNEHISSLTNFVGLLGPSGWNGKEFDIPAGVWTVKGEKFIPEYHSVKP